VYVGRASNRWRTHTSVHVVPLFVGKKEPKGGEGHLVLVPHEGGWVGEESGPKRWRPPAALFVPPTRQSSAVATAARAAAQKKKVLDERERPGTRMHAWGSFLLSAFAPTRRYHHIYVLTVVAYRRLQFKQCRTSSIRGHPSHVRTYVQYILVCCCEKKHNRCISCGWSHVS
jgi:hypothetical protein